MDLAERMRAQGAGNLKNLGFGFPKCQRQWIGNLEEQDYESTSEYDGVNEDETSSNKEIENTTRGKRKANSQVNKLPSLS